MGCPATRRDATGSTTSTACRHAGRGDYRGPPRRSDLVGPSRLERDRLDAGRRGIVPRAVRARGARPAAPDHAGVRAPTRRRRASGWPRSSTAIGVPVAAQLLGTGSGTDSLAVLVGTWSELHGTFAGEPDRPRAVSQRRIRALRRSRRQFARAARPARSSDPAPRPERGSGRRHRAGLGRAHLARRRHRRRRGGGGGRGAHPDSAA